MALSLELATFHYPRQLTSVGLPDPDPDPLVRGTVQIWIRQNFSKKFLRLEIICLRVSYKKRRKKMKTFFASLKSSEERGRIQSWSRMDSKSIEGSLGSGLTSNEIDKHYPQLTYYHVLLPGIG